MTPGRVLVVEDEAALRVLIERYLARHGYEVEGSSSGEDAIASINRDPSRFDLFLLDVSLPGISGLELARAILDSRPDARILLVSGFACDTEQIDPNRTGRIGFLAKPFLPSELGEAVRTLAES